MECGDAIASALQRYRSDNHKYPPTLDHLVPDYVPEIPAPVAGDKRWEYSRRDPLLSPYAFCCLTFHWSEKGWRYEKDLYGATVTAWYLVDNNFVLGRCEVEEFHDYQDLPTESSGGHAELRRDATGDVNGRNYRFDRTGFFF